MTPDIFIFERRRVVLKSVISIKCKFNLLVNDDSNDGIEDDLSQRFGSI